jgi:hypothetical protein
MRIKFRAQNQYNLDYLRYIFDARPGEDVNITLTEDFGRMAMAMFQPCEKRDAKPDDELTVYLRLPRHKTIAGTTHRIYYPAAMQRRLNLLLSAQFNNELNTYYAQGIALGIPKKEIIEAFMDSRRMTSVDGIDTLGKRVYRSDVAVIRKKVEALLKKAQYNQSLIEPPAIKKQ